MELINSFTEYDYKLSKASSLYNGLFGEKLFYLVRIVLKVFEWSGHGIPWLIYSFWFALTTKNLDEQKPFLLLSMGLILDLLVIAILKLTFKRSRPEYNEGDLPLSASKIDGYSFPSGHATRATMLVVLYMHLSNVQLYQVYVILWAFMLCCSRVMLGRHFITDVVVGTFVGIAEGLVTIRLPLDYSVEFIHTNFLKDFYEFVNLYMSP